MNKVPRPRSKYIYWAAGASGAAGLIYEVVWSRALTNTIGATSHSFSILLAAFMAGLAIGGYYGGQYISDKENAVRVFGLLQLGIGLTGGLTLLIINNLPPLYAQLYYWLKLSFNAFTVAQTALVFMVMLVPTTLMGATFPVAVKAWSKHEQEVGRNVGGIYSINTWGAVIGALLAGFILIPVVGLRWASVIAASINMTLALLAFLSVSSRRLAAATAAVFVLSVGLALIKPAPGIAFGYGLADHHSSYEDFQEIRGGFDIVFNKDSDYGPVQIGIDRDESSFRTLIAGGRYEGSTFGDATTTKLLSYLPLAIHKKPDDVLVIGLGLGRTVKAAQADSRIERIDNVEINPVVYEAIEEYIYPGLFDDPRLSAISDDGRHYMLITDRTYDVIISQPSYPTSNGVSHLFTADFYRLVHKKLNKGGIYVQWLPDYLLDDSELNIAIKTVASVFPNVSSWHSATQDVIILASNSEQPIDPAAVRKYIDNLNDPALGSWSFVADQDEIAKLTRDPQIPINRDDLPLIEFAAARSKITRTK